MQAALITVSLLRAAAVFEEWSLIDGAPLREELVVRVTYPGGEERDALLPAITSRGLSVTVFEASTGARLPARHRPEGFVVELPRGAARRVVVRVARAVPSTRAFHLRWPEAGTPGARRTVVFPRAWLREPAEGWSCPGLDERELVCVARGSTTAFTLRVPAHNGGRGAWPGALLLGSLALGGSARLGRDRVEAILAALGGLGVAAALSLALVGAHLISWPTALAALSPPCAALGAIATRGRASRLIGSVALAALPLLVSLGASIDRVIAAALAFAGMILAAATTAPTTSPQ